MQFQFTLSWRERLLKLPKAKQDELFQFTLSWRERLNSMQEGLIFTVISIHALLKRATYCYMLTIHIWIYFNSRSPEESDLIIHYILNHIIYFNSRSPEESDKAWRIYNLKLFYFKSRSPEESDWCLPPFKSIISIFQFTLYWRERQGNRNNVSNTKWFQFTLSWRERLQIEEVDGE